ncbi:glutamyl-tRNA reductase [Pectinatus frisingensis]|jgi:glutamyl-tRNA reductase|uniref:glutamyl-tRNA reductase n=1 Tax=Pectinatus frisingensis TaxID=865 RepID=UPI0015F3AED8|nr:glutamyl-tRNA reductase [Pectinatus frisingensis]
MQLAVLGLNHKTAPVNIREKFSISSESVIEGLHHIDDYGNILEAVVLSTCNRSEIYAVLDDGNEGRDTLKRFLFDLTGNEDDIDYYLYYYPDHACIQHLFQVASSLDSLIIGEGQILSQVKKAYTIARENGATSTVLNTLFHRAISTGKRVRTETHIAYNAVSVSYAAVELARTVFKGDLSNSSALIYGAGETAELTAKNLLGKDIKKIYIANRHIEKARLLADKFDGKAVPFDKAFTSTEDIDIVVTSTGAPHYVVKTWETQQFMARRKGRPLIFIDIAVPRDVDPDVAKIKGVLLYNIDDLKAVVEDNIKRRGQEAKIAYKIIGEEVDELIERFRYLSFRPVMVLLTDKADRIRCREVKRAMNKLENITPAQERVIENMSKMIVRKLLREPMTKLNSSAGTSQEKFYIDAMKKLFKLDVLKEKNSEKQNSYRYAQQ